VRSVGSDVAEAPQQSSSASAPAGAEAIRIQRSCSPGAVV